MAKSKAPRGRSTKAESMKPEDRLADISNPAIKLHTESTRDRQEFFLPVTGFVWFYPEERKVIDHPAFQRLGRINQLGQCSFVFRGATHKRIEHVLGAVHIAQRMIAAVSANQDKLMKLHGWASAELSDLEFRFVRLGTLLHDIGHLAAGHTLEDELGICSPHDADKRLELLFKRHPADFDAEGDQTLEDVINQEYGPYVRKYIKHLQITPSELVRLLIRKHTDPEDPSKLPEIERKYFDLHHQVSQSTEIRLDLCSNMIGNTICADLLDYLYRDWVPLIRRITNLYLMSMGVRLFDGVATIDL